MSLVAPVEDGKVVTSTSAESLSSSSSSKSDNSTVSSDTFLALLVAEMQNQDPLEPTSNTEWVSQYATFTEVEKMDEMSESMNLLRANDLVGKNVIMKVTSSSTGDTSYVQGIVDFVTFENGKAYLYIGDQPYSLDDLDTVATQEYTDAYAIASEFKSKMSSLPTIGNITTSYQKTVQELLDTYNGMTDYQKEFIPSTYVSALKSYKEALEKLGVKFTEDTEETTTTMDDLLLAFNTKMDAILANMKSASTSGTGSSSEDTIDTSDDSVENVDEATSNDSENVDNSTEDSNETVDTSKDSSNISESDKTESSEQSDASQKTDNSAQSDSSDKTESSDTSTESSDDGVTSE